LVDVDFLSDLPNQILVKRSGYAFIVDVKYEILPLFCSNCEMIDYDQSNYRRLQQDIMVGRKQLAKKYN